MKKLLTTALIIASLCAFRQVHAAGTITYLEDATSTADLQTYTFSSQNLGTAASDRCIVVTIGTRDTGATTKTIDSVTIGGVSATIVIQKQYAVTNSTVSGIAIAAVPTGTTGDVVITMSEAMLRMATSIYRVDGVDCTVSTDAEGSIVSGPSASLYVPAGGVAVGTGAFSSAGSTVTWSGLTEDTDTMIESLMLFTSASGAFATEQNPLSTSITESATEEAATFVSWGPAVTTAPSKWFVPYLINGRSASGATYVSPFGDGSNGSATNENLHMGIAPSVGTVKNLRVMVNPAPGAGKSWTFTFRTDAVDTSLTCQIADTNTTCSDTTHTSHVSAGQMVSHKITPAGTPTTGSTTIMVDFAPTTAGETSLMGNSSANFSQTQTPAYFMFVGSGGSAASVSSRQIVMPTSGTLKNLYTYLSVAPGTGNSRTYTVNQNGSDTALAVTYSNSDVNIKSDTSDTIAVSAGDLISLKVASTSFPAVATGAWGVTFVPTTVGDFIIPASHNGTSANNATTYLPMEGFTTGSPTQTETAAQTLGWSDYVIKALYVDMNNAPASGKSWTLSLRENMADAATTFSTAIVGPSATAGNTTGAFTPTNWALYDTQTVPSGTPTATIIRATYLASANTTPSLPTSLTPAPPVHNAFQRGLFKFIRGLYKFH